MEGGTEGQLEIPPCVLQETSPLEPLPEKADGGEEGREESYKL